MIYNSLLHEITMLLEMEHVGSGKNSQRRCGHEGNDAMMTNDDEETSGTTQFPLYRSCIVKHLAMALYIISGDSEESRTLSKVPALIPSPQF